MQINLNTNFMNIIQKKEILIKICLIIIVFFLVAYLLKNLLSEKKEGLELVPSLKNNEKDEDYEEISTDEIEKIMFGEFDKKKSKSS